MAKTSKQKPLTPETAYQRVFKDISKILAPNEDYIYRGEDEQFDRPCASSLYRESKKVLKGDVKGPAEPLEEVVARLSKWNRERLVEEISAYYPDTTDNERLAAVQHLGGATNFVDFSEDLNVSLFFACYKNPDKDGRIIVMPSPKSERESTSMKKSPTSLETLNDNKVFIPRRTGSDPGYQRARAQKGLVVYCPEGYLKEDKYKTVEIAGRDKLPILEYLHKYHGIDYQTIFYDVHGYIELTKYRHTLLREYVIAFGRKKYELAEKRISELINLGGTYWEYTTRGVLHGIQGNYTQAVSDYSQAIDLNSKYSVAYCYRGNVYYSQEKYDQAILDYARAIELNPKYIEAYHNRGNAYYSKKDYAQAKLDYDRTSVAYNNRGNTYYAQRDYAQAILDYDQAIRFKPEDSMAYQNRGNAYYAQRDYAQAILDYDQVIRLNPEDSMAYNNRGNAYYAQRDYARAILDYNQAIRFKPEDSMAYQNRGNAYYAQRDYAQALWDYDQAIRLNPEDSTAHYNRGNVYRLQENYAQALWDYDRAISLNSEYSVAYYNRGLAHIAEDNPERDVEQAKKDYLKAVELNSELGDPQYRKPFEKYL